MENTLQILAQKDLLGNRVQATQDLVSKGQIKETENGVKYLKIEE